MKHVWSFFSIISASVLGKIRQRWWITLMSKLTQKKKVHSYCATLVYSRPSSGRKEKNTQRKKNYISRSVMYQAVGYIRARSSFKTSWGTAKKVSEQYLQPYGWGNAFCCSWHWALWKYLILYRYNLLGNHVQDVYGA